jgi:cell division protein FtsI/penicillin-binding protein 2
LFEGRLNRLLALLAGLYAVFLARVFWLQTSGAEEARREAAARRSSWCPVPPRRGTIRDRDGLVLARDEVGFDLMAEARGLGAVEWECEGCGRVVTTWETDPGDGLPADAPPIPAAPPGPCRSSSCEGRDAWRPTFAADRLAVADLLGEPPGALGADLERARLEGWRAAREAAAGRSDRRRRTTLRDWLTRPRRVRTSVAREAAMEVALHPDRYPGLAVSARAERFLDPSLDAATRLVVGRTGAARDIDLLERAEEFEADGLDPSELARMTIGRTGIERAFDADLRGSFGLERRERGSGGASAAREVVTPAYDGQDVVLTLSAHYDSLAESLLEGRRGALVALDPRDGALLALGGTAGVEQGEPLAAITGMQPGSVLKVLTALVALEGDLAPLPGEVTCRGKASRPVSCEHLHGSPGMVEALAGSCNAYFGVTGVRIGVGPLQDFARRFHLDRPFGLGLVPEGGGTDWSQERVAHRRWAREDAAQIAVGQGPVLLSPVQVGALICAVANGGRPVRPHLVSGGGREPDSPVVSPQALATVRAGLEETVRSGTASNAGLGRFRAAGKTGTAQIGNGRGLNAWFAGYAPAEDPRIVVVVVLEDQDLSGGHAAAPVAARFLEAWAAREGLR